MTQQKKSEAEVCAWMIETVATLLAIDRAAVQPRSKFSDLGLDSTTALQLIGRVEEDFGYAADPESILSHPTVEAFARFIAKHQ